MKETTMVVLDENNTRRPAATRRWRRPGRFLKVARNRVYTWKLSRLLANLSRFFKGTGVLLPLGLLLTLLVWEVAILSHGALRWTYKHSSCFISETARSTAWAIPETNPRPCPIITTPQNNRTVLPPHDICITSLTDNADRQSQTLSSWWLRLTRCRNFDSIGPRIRANHERYAARHGYRYTMMETVDSSRPPAWSKIKAVQEQFEGGCQWVMWLDADAVIMNPAIRLEHLIDKDADLIATPDFSFAVSSGVWLIRNSEWSRHFLDEWWNLRSFVRSKGLSLSGDNKAFGHLVKEKLGSPSEESHIRVSPSRCSMNSNGLFVNEKNIDVATKRNDWKGSTDFYHTGDFIAHASGIDRKLVAVEALLERAT